MFQKDPPKRELQELETRIVGAAGKLAVPMIGAAGAVLPMLKGTRDLSYDLSSRELEALNELFARGGADWDNEFYL